MAHEAFEEFDPTASDQIDKDCTHDVCFRAEPSGLDIGLNAHLLSANVAHRELLSQRPIIGPRAGSFMRRTLLMSPAMVAAAAITGAVADVREILR